MGHPTFEDLTCGHLAMMEEYDCLSVGVLGPLVCEILHLLAHVDSLGGLRKTSTPVWRAFGGHLLRHQAQLWRIRPTLLLMWTGRPSSRGFLMVYLMYFGGFLYYLIDVTWRMSHSLLELGYLVIFLHYFNEGGFNSSHINTH